MGVQYRSVSGSDGGWMVNDDNLADECLCHSRWVVRVAHDFASPNLVLCDAPDVEPNVVPRLRFGHSNVVCLDRLAFSHLPRWHEDHLVSVLQYSRLDASYRDGPDSGYRVNVLDGNSQWLVERLWWWNNSVQRFEYADAFVPWSIGTLLGEVISQPSASGNEVYLGNVIADCLQQSLQFFSCFLVAFFSVLDRLVIHLVDGYNELLNAEGSCEVRVFACLTSRSNGYFEFSFLCGNYEYGNVRLAGAGNHVLDEVAVSWRIDNSVEIVIRLELLE